jgi:uncharacterized membrane protein YccC
VDVFAGRSIKFGSIVYHTDQAVAVDSSHSFHETTPAIRAATAVAICLVCAERLHLQQPGLAVWSTYMVMVQYSFTTFQKGLERIVGRGAGILIALILATLTRNAWGLGFALEMLAIVPLFYVYFSGRLSYTFLNAGLYLAAVMEISRTAPETATTQAGDLFSAIVLGVTVAVLVAWVSGAEKDVTIHTEGQPLWPLDYDRLVHSVMLMLTVALVHLVSHVLRLSTTTTVVSVMLLTITPDYQSLLQKGGLRLVGAALAILYATVSLVLLVRQPSFPLLVFALFLGTFLAVAVARGSARWSYAGVQMGLVLPMILVVPHQEFGSLASAFTRVGGAMLAIAASMVVGVVWAAVAPSPPLALGPQQPTDLAVERQAAR